METTIDACPCDGELLQHDGCRQRARERMTALRAVDAMEPLTRDSTIKALRQHLRERSGKTWSVKGGRGTAWGWITVTAPPSRLNAYGSLTDADRAELSALLGQNVHQQGFNVPASYAHYRWALLLAMCGASVQEPEPYWD